MKAPAVGLDHDPLLGPEEVDRPAPDPDIDERCRNPVAATEGEEAALEVAPRSVAGAAGSQRESTDLGLPQRPPLEAAGRRRGAGPRSSAMAGDRDQAADRQGLRRERARRWTRIPCRAPAAVLRADGYFDRPTHRPQQIPQRGRGAMAEDRGGTAGEHRGHPPSPLTRARVDRRVDAAMNPVQAPLPALAVEIAADAEARLPQLRCGDEPVLTRREARDRRVSAVHGAFPTIAFEKRHAQGSLPRRGISPSIRCPCVERSVTRRSGGRLRRCGAAGRDGPGGGGLADRAGAAEPRPHRRASTRS